jgi:hypothetical protein
VDNRFGPDAPADSHGGAVAEIDEPGIAPSLGGRLLGASDGLGFSPVAPGRNLNPYTRRQVGGAAILGVGRHRTADQQTCRYGASNNHLYALLLLT